MKKQKPVHVVSENIRGQRVLIEVFRSRAGYWGSWRCKDIDCSGASSKHDDDIEFVVIANRINAAAGIGGYTA